MPVEVILPKVDMDMATGSIATWHVAEGDDITKGMPLFDIETDKAAMEVEAPATGRLHHIMVPIGSEVPIGTTLAWIYAEGEDVGPPPQGSVNTTPSAGNETSAQEASPEAPATPEPAQPNAALANDSAQPGADKIRATPAARRLASHNAIDLPAITGTGPRGRVQRADVEARLEAPISPSLVPPPGTLQSWSPQPGDLSVLSSGTDTGTPWVLIHGFAADANGWTLLEKQLGKSAPVHRIELPNHGRSPRRRVDGFPDLVSQIRHAFDSLNVGEVRLVGHSLGAAVSLALADTRPRKIKNLSLISPAGLGPDINGAALEGIANASRAESLGPWLKQLTGDPDLVTTNYIQAAFAPRRDGELRAAQHDMMDHLFPDGVQAFDVRAALKRINCPTRIIWGKSDRIIPWKQAMGVPGTVSLNLFPDIGHLPHVEIPDQIVALITQ